MKNIRTQLWILTIAMGIPFLDGLLTIGIPEGLYILLGLTMIATLVWLWIDYNRK